MNWLYTESHYLFYLIGSFLFYNMYFVTDLILTAYNENYIKLNNDKKMYAVSNLLKSVQLGLMTPLAGYVLFDSMYNNHWENTLIKNLGVLYAMPDTISLIKVKKMDLTTKIHHVVVCLFNVASIHNDYNNNNIVRCLLIYAVFSTFAFIVNFMLGVRFLHTNKNIDRMLSRCSFYVYTMCCMINWIWHYFYVSELYGECETTGCKIGISTYIFLVGTIAIDDIKLNKWLFKKSEFLVLKAE